MDPLLAISFKSFSSVWYWIMTGIAWSMTCHWTLGVPYDSLVRAHSGGGDAAREAETLAELNIRRTVALFEKGAAIVVAIIAFLLAVCATFGFAYGYELAQALFMLVLPLTLVQALNVRLAFRIYRANPTGAEVRAALVRRRFWNQVIGLTSIVFAAMLAFLQFAPDVVLWFTGW